MQKYLDRIATLAMRESSGSYELLTPNQQFLFSVIKDMARNSGDQALERKQIQQNCGAEFDFDNRNNFITDFCYNKVNLEDNANKFLLSVGRGKFIFVGFDWMNQEEHEITWHVRELGKEFIVGAYKQGQFFWHFDKLIQALISPPEILAEEVIDPEHLYEGARKQITVNAYERNSAARQQCIEYHGTDCSVCGFSFSAVYGAVGAGFIHVHHLKPLAEVGREYQVNPITDLIPICPNCHAMLHRRNPPYTVQELKQMMSCKNLHFLDL